MKIENRKTIFADLKKFGGTAYYPNNEYIEVTEWTNGEGYDININDNKHISLHHTELEAVNYLVKILEYGNLE